MNFGGIDDEIMEQEEEKVTSFEERKEKPKRRPFHYWKVGEREYKLKLTTAMIEKLENKYRTNVLNLVSDDMPALSVMLTIVQAAMAPWEHGISYPDLKRIYDTWTESGGNQMEFYMNVVMPTLAVSGFFTETQAEAMMESLKSAEDLM